MLQLKIVKVMVQQDFIFWVNFELVIGIFFFKFFFVFFCIFVVF